MSDIGAEWSELQSTRRDRDAACRFTTQHVVGVGAVNVLKSNNYDMNQGEQSVWGKELGAAGAAAASGAGFSRRQVAGRDYDHIEYCISCKVPLLSFDL